VIPLSYQDPASAGALTRLAPVLLCTRSGAVEVHLYAPLEPFDVPS